MADRVRDIIEGAQIQHVRTRFSRRAQFAIRNANQTNGGTARLVYVAEHRELQEDEGGNGNGERGLHMTFHAAPDEGLAARARRGAGH